MDISALGYNFLQKLTGHVYLCEKNGQKQVVKFSTQPEIVSRIISESNNLTLVNQLIRSESLKLNKLIIAPLLNFQSETAYAWLAIPYYGQPYPYSELETESQIMGGKAINTDTVNLISEGLSELRLAPKDNWQLPVWDLQKAREDYNVCYATLAPIFNLDKIKNTLDRLFFELDLEYWPAHPSLSNGDFYFRNLLPQNERLALVDWERARITVLEETAAYIWVLAYNNPAWQSVWGARVMAKLRLDSTIYCFYQILHTLKLLAFWFGLKDKAIISRNLFMLLKNVEDLVG